MNAGKCLADNNFVTTKKVNWIIQHTKVPGRINGPNFLTHSFRLLSMARDI